MIAEKKGMVKLHEVKIRELRKNNTVTAINEELLEEGMRKCVMYRAIDPKTNHVTYYLGGGIYNVLQHKIVLRKDCLRPLVKDVVPVNKISYVKFDGMSMDILLNNGIWISGIVFPKLKSDGCNLAKIKFNDKRIIIRFKDVAIVNLPLLDISEQDLYEYRNFSYIPVPSNLFSYSEPLTYAYIKKEQDIYVGFWDVTNSKFVGELQRYGGRSLDIGI